MIGLIGLAISYLIGFNICFWMLQTEHKAEGNVYTIGDRIACFLLSLFSWGTILWVLISAWVYYIRRTGYWNKPVSGEQVKSSSNGVKHKQPV